MEPRRTWRTVRRALGLRCPRCGQAPIFVRGYQMRPGCPRCGLRFEREPGYFTGAMYVSYILALPVLGICVLAVYLLAPSLSFWASVAAAVVLFLPWVPAIFRYSRVIWIHLDQTIDPSS